MSDCLSVFVNVPFFFALVRTVVPREVDDDAGRLGRTGDVAGVRVLEHLELVRLERVGYGGIVRDEPVPHDDLDHPPHEAEVLVPTGDDPHPGSPVPGGRVRPSRSAGGVLQHGHVVEAERDGGRRVDHEAAYVLPLDDFAGVARELALPDAHDRAHEVGRLLGGTGSDEERAGQSLEGIREEVSPCNLVRTSCARNSIE